MKKVIVLLALFLAFGYQTIAQDANAKRIEKWTKDLSLSADQVTQIKTAFTERKTKIDAAKANMESVNMTAIKAAKEEFQGKMKTILTPEQQTKLSSMTKKRKGRKFKKGKNGKPSKEELDELEIDDLD
jgi:Spy/CpxP family protein refolding chaperone